MYANPLLLIVGWRGEPGVKDEPQHVKQGRVTLPLLDAMGISYGILDGDSNSNSDVIERGLDCVVENGTSYALVVKKGAFETYAVQDTTERFF